VKLLYILLFLAIIATGPVICAADTTPEDNASIHSLFIGDPCKNLFTDEQFWQGKEEYTDQHNQPIKKHAVKTLCTIKILIFHRVYVIEEKTADVDTNTFVQNKILYKALTQANAPIAMTEQEAWIFQRASIKFFLNQYYNALSREYFARFASYDKYPTKKSDHYGIRNKKTIKNTPFDARFMALVKGTQLEDFVFKKPGKGQKNYCMDYKEEDLTQIIRKINDNIRDIKNFAPNIKPAKE